jgi:hypothetical protein
MAVSNSRAGKVLAATRAYRFFGRDRETISEAYAGDIIGLVNPGQFAIGDTLHTGAPLRSSTIPRFPAEHFGAAALQDTRYKQFDEGLKQLEEEGLMQVFYVDSGRREPIVGVVGALQFDVITSRCARSTASRSPSIRRRSRGALGRRSGQAAAAARRRDHRRRSIGRTARAAVRQRVGSAVLREAEPDVSACWRNRLSARDSPVRQKPEHYRNNGRRVWLKAGPHGDGNGLQHAWGSGFKPDLRRLFHSPQ